MQLAPCFTVTTSGNCDTTDQHCTDFLEEDHVADQQACPGCGMEPSVWKGNGGQGVVKDGTTYCCEECSKGTGCICG